VLHSIGKNPATDSAEELADAIGADPRVVTWPEEPALHGLVVRTAQAILKREGMYLPGLVHALVARVMPLLTQARVQAWDGGSNPIHGVELTGEASISGHTVGFRVDEVRTHEGHLELVDFKTGRPLADLKTPAARRKHLLRALARGRALQAGVYARAVGENGRGIYLYLTDSDVACEEARRVEVAADDTAAMRRLEHAVDLLIQAQLAGIQMPRLNERPEGDRRRPRMCDRCAVAPACLQHESTARARQRRWIDAHIEVDGEDESFAGLAAALWWMRPPAGEDKAAPPGDEA
jgi:hypothetical protein